MPRTPKIPKTQLLSNHCTPIPYLEYILRIAARNNLHCFQYRTMPGEYTYQTALLFAKLCQETNIQYIVNNQVDIVSKLRQEGFDAGVWLGQSDIPVTEARALLGNNAFIGLSVNTEAEVVAANNQPVNAVAANGVFACINKPQCSTNGTRRPAGITLSLCPPYDCYWWY